MKKLIVWVICFICIISIVGCEAGAHGQFDEDIDNDTAVKEEQNTVDDDKNDQIEDKDTVAFDIDYIVNLMADVTNAKAFGIKKEYPNVEESDINGKETTFKTAQRTSNNNNGKVELNNELQPGNIERYYLYSTTKEINNGDIEFEKTSITKISFRLNKNATEDVYDHNGDIISESSVIEQEDIPAQINRLYVTDEFIYMQFVPLVSKSGTYRYIDEEGNLQSEEIIVRPDGLVYDENGVAEFDKTGYYSSKLSKCFVISVSTGYIYSISEVNIDGFINGLLSIDNSYYRIFVENDELHIEDVLPNKDVSVSNVVKDNYGWIFVANNRIDDIDETAKIIYTTNRFIWKDKYNNIYETAYMETAQIPFIKYEFINGKKEVFTSEKLIKGLGTIFKNYYKSALIAVFSDLKIYDGTISSGGGWLLSSNLAVDRGKWFDDNFDCVIRETEEGISYAIVDIFSDLETKQELTEADFINISSKCLYREQNNYYQKIGKDQYLLNNVYAYIGINGTEYYQLLKKDNSLNLREIEKIDYTNDIYIFQPINK